MHIATALPPTYSVSPANIGHGPFVIALIDPDALTPQNPNISQINHFLGGNFFVGKQHDCLLVNTTPAVTEYYGPHPPKVVDSDPHRWVFHSCPNSLRTSMLTALFQVHIFAVQTTSTIQRAERGDPRNGPLLPQILQY